MPDYPGVDPDGLSPGGLQVAGRVNAGSLAIAGGLVTPSAVAVGSWNCNNGLSMIDGASAYLPFDTESRALADIAYSAGSISLTVLTDGIYLCLADAYSNVGWVAGFLGLKIATSATHGLPLNASILGHEGSDTGSLLETAIFPLSAGDTISLNALNHTGATDTIFGDISICRLA